jgi:cyclic nucleotide gated channel alpha 3
MNALKDFKKRLSNQWKLQVFDPSSRVYYYWLLIYSIVYLYNLIFLVARATFWLLQDSTDLWYLFDYAISDLIYIIDIFVQLNTGFIENGEFCKDHKKIQQKYLKSRSFLIDLISILPTDLFYFTLNPWSKHKIAALRLNRLLRVNRFSEFLQITETQTSFPYLIRVIKLVLSIFFIFHFIACFYFEISSFIGFGSDNWVYPSVNEPYFLANKTQVELNNMVLYHTLSTQYIYCIWWSTLCLTTIAEVPEPFTWAQEVLMIFILLSGVILLAYVIGSTSNMFNTMNKTRDLLQEKCDEVKIFLKQNNIDKELRDRVKTYLDYIWSLPNLDQQDSVLSILPPMLANEIAINIHMDTLKRIKIFEDFSIDVIRELVSKLKLKIFSPGDYVCRKGDIGREMYLIKTGKLEVVSEDGKKVFVSLSAGAAFGELSILDIPGNKNGNKRTANIRSVGFSDLFQLTKDDLWSVLSEYPKAKEILMERGKAILRKDNLLDEELAEKAEQKAKPISEQLDHYENSIIELNEKLTEMFKTYDEFLRKIKKKITLLEKNKTQ